MNPPALEVAEIFRAFGHRFIERSRFAWPQHKVRVLRSAAVEWAAAGG
jgi:hypothetical protein